MAPPPPHRLIDFHSHYYSPAWYPFSSAQQSSTLAQAWPLLTNIHSQLVVMDDAGIDAKVLSAPAALITAPGKRLPITMMERINDHFAALVAAEPRRLLALATIDPFQGDAAAREAERAITSLGMGGICEIEGCQRFLNLASRRDWHNWPVAAQKHMFCSQQFDGEAQCHRIETHGVHVQAFAGDARQ